MEGGADLHDPGYTHMMQKIQVDQRCEGQVPSEPPLFVCQGVIQDVAGEECDQW